jgi:ADP-ribosylglycohydrolase
MDADDRTTRALAALEGTALGDAFGERWFIDPALIEGLLGERALPRPPWRWTDDTAMAASVYAVLREAGELSEDALAASLAHHYAPDRGYGPAMHGLLADLRGGVPWEVAARSLFDGAGSWGNGAAMRVAPLGAYYADDVAAAVDAAKRSAGVTHAHREAAAGAIAVAVAAALVATVPGREAPRGTDLLREVRVQTPTGEVADGIERAIELTDGASVAVAARALGNGSRISCPDTVPFALWCAAHHLDDFEEAMWITVSALGDRDTTCAIVGGIVGAHVGLSGLPLAWLEHREPLPPWIG